MEIVLWPGKFYQLATVIIFTCRLMKCTSWQKSQSCTSWKILHIWYFCHGGLLFCDLIIILYHFTLETYCHLCYTHLHYTLSENIPEGPTETTKSSFFPYKQVSWRNGDHKWFRMTNAFILCDLIWKIPSEQRR